MFIFTILGVKIKNKRKKRLVLKNKIRIKIKQQFFINHNILIQ